MTINALRELIQPVAIFGSYDGTLQNVCIDSRKVGKNDVFVALPGTKSDGHDYIREAVRKGAAVIIAESDPETVLPQNKIGKSGAPVFFKVASTTDIVGPLALAFAGNPVDVMKMIGITGTNGKTTVMTLVYQVLHKLGYNAGMIGTVEIRIADEVRPSRLTTPDAVTLADVFKDMAEKDTAYAIMEVSSHAIDQKRVKGISFDVAAFTNISQDHLDYHDSMASYIETKKKLFDGLGSDSIAVVNKDDPAYTEVIKDCHAEIWEFGFSEEREFKILDEGSDGMVLDLDGTIVSTPLAGRFNAYNVAQAYLICLALGCTKASVANALSDSRGARGRLERVDVSSETTYEGTGQMTAPAVFVDYAHTPDALENVLKTLVKVKKAEESLHVVFGCGGDRDRSKRAIMGEIAERYADVLTITSDNPRTEDPDRIIRDIRKGISRSENIFIQSDRKKAIRSAILDADTRSIVLVAGKGHETYQEVHGRRHKFDDSDVASTALIQWIDRRSGRKSSRKRKSKTEVT